MKKYERKILGFEVDNFFYPLRNKLDYIKVLLLTVRKLIIKDNEYGATAKLKVIISKYNRAFYYSGNKYYSIVFPFDIIEDENGDIEVQTKSDKIISSKVISELFSILKDKQFANNPSLINYYFESDTSVSYDSISILEDLLLQEPAYVRYDYDEKNAMEQKHPLHHLDINYSSAGTYKIGLKKSIDDVFFEDLQDTTTNCRFLDH